MNIVERFRECVERWGYRTAVVDARREWTYRQIMEEAQRIAGLTTSGSENVGITLAPSGEFVAAVLGVWMNGKRSALLNTLLPPPQLAALIKSAAIDTVVTDAFLKETKQRASAAARAESGECALLLFTSGTGSEPKGVQLSHRNLLSNADGCQRRINLREGDAILTVLPLFHAFGFTCGALLPLLNGAIVVLPSSFSPQAIVQSLNDKRVRAMLSVPSIYRMLMKVSSRGKGTFSFPPLCISGGEALGEELEDRFDAAFDAPLLNGYGMTETSPVISMSTPSERKRGSVGRPLPEVEVRIAADGEICARGPNVMMGYLNDPEATRAIKSEDGWLMTGDIGRIDGDGYLFIVDRKKDLIISSGENIAPAEIEAVLLQHPDVAEAAVVAMADATRGEVPRACIVPHKGKKCAANEIVAFCGGRLPPFKVPHQVTFLDALPRNALGKVMKRLLRDG